MVIKGGARGGPVGLAAHLERTDENERVTLIGIHGLAARDVEGALIEMDALGAGLKTSRTLYHVSINVGYGDRMSEERWQTASAALREKLDLGGQPYIEIEHEKKGRTHRHFVVSRTDIEHNRAIRADHNYRTHEQVARELERQFGHERVQGAHVERDGKDRPERTPSYAEMQQAKRTGMTPQEAKEFVTGLWQTTDSGKAFNAALEAHGWMLARGDKRDFVLLDPQGEPHSLARRVEGAKAKDVRARMADLDPAMLPGVDAARTLQQERAADRAPAPEREAAGQAADMRPEIERATDHRDALSPAARREEAEQAFRHAAAETTEPGSKNCERDTGSRNEAAPAPEEVQQQPGATAGRETRGGRDEPSAVSESQPAAAIERKSKTASRIFGGFAKIAETILGGVFSFFVAEPKLTPAQARDRARAEGNEETLYARAGAEAEQAKRADQDWRIAEQDRQQRQQQHEAEMGLSERFGTPPPGRTSGRERERER